MIFLLKNILHAGDEGALRKGMEKKIFPIEEVVATETNEPFTIDTITDMSVDHKPSGKTLVGVWIYIGVVQRGVEHAAGSATE